MARRVFFSFHYKPDNWRAAQVRQAGVVEGERPISDNDWETVTRGGDAAIQRWIDAQLEGKSCVVVLIGSATAGRKWIEYEISAGWNAGKGVVGIHIHNLLDANQAQSRKGANPLDGVTFKSSGRALSTIAKTYDPPYTRSTDVYDYIKTNLEKWVEEAISIRAAN